MNCHDFKKMALSDPYSKQESFIKHAVSCAKCSRYVAELRQMDSDLKQSLDVALPQSLTAKLELNQLLRDEARKKQVRSKWMRYSIAASLALAFFVSGFMASSFFDHRHTIAEDYQTLLAGVIEHMNEDTLVPVMASARANESATTHLASYDGKLKMKYLENLQFFKLCPMGEYRGIHASLETIEGHVTFAYIRGELVDEMTDNLYKGYVTRVKPLKDGNLVIISRTNKALLIADQQLEEAMYWET